MGAGLAAALVAAVAISPFAVQSASASTFVTATIRITSSTRPDPAPVDVAVDASTRQAFVASTFDGTVSVIDTEANRVTEVIPNGPTSIGAGPSGVALDPVHHQVFVSNYNSDTVSVIDTTTNEVTKVIPHDNATSIGSGPDGIGVDPDRHRAYVANVKAGTVSVIDTDTNTVKAVLPHDSAHGIGKFPLNVAVDTDLHRVFVTNLDDDTVSVIDALSDTVMTVIPHDSSTGIGKAPRRIAIDSVAHRAFVTNEGDSTVSVIDTSRNSVIAVIPHDSTNGIGDNPDGVAVDVIGHQAYIGTERLITAIDTLTLSVTRVIRKSDVDYGSGLQGIAMDADHRQAFVTGSNSNTIAVIDLDSTAPLVRRGGADRFEVSARNSAAEFAPDVPVAYIASGTAFADALSGSAAAGSRGAPVLLTASDSIPTVVGAELARLKPKRIIILGGTTSVSSSVQRALAGYAPTVDRLGGADRYAVAAAVSRDNFSPGIPVAYLASGTVFPDALSGSAVAANNGGPVLLTTKDAIPPATVDELARLRPNHIVILGGTNTVSAAVESQLKASMPTTRVGGADRFEVSANASASNFTGGVNVAYVASGQVFADALSGSPAAAANGAPVLLVAADAIPASVANELDRLNPVQIVVLGGPNSVSDGVYEQLRGFLR
ncbi:cell wall-binding repeat-containing protein [Herbiconiux sp. YIM B11900]|uniref:cell wall-binding repeat-containing protein n=1 Tax=Herbiconiux sp. YIM B11900 TaxID=3404131 RepID=UPI003F86661F